MPDERGSWVPKSHPRYQSLMIRERLVSGFENGLVAHEGLLAHGRGEAFDYMIGEKTHRFADEAIYAAGAMMNLGKHVVVSVNGNAAALCPADMVAVADACDGCIEVNLFYRTEERVARIAKVLEDAGGRDVLGLEPDARIPGLDGARAKCSSKGIAKADVVLVPLEDGDRTEALKRAGKKVITVDLNPMSRTAQTADITIVDNIVRAMPKLAESVGDFKGTSRSDLEEIIEKFNNQEVMGHALGLMRKRLGGIGGRRGEKAIKNL